MWQWFQDLQDSASSTLSQWNNSSFKNGMMATCALIAAADGKIDDGEKKKVAALIQKNEMLQVFNASELRDLFLKYCDDATDDFARLDLLNVVRKLKSSEEQADTALKVALLIANADGNFSPEEQKVVSELCSVLGLSAANYSKA